MENPYAAYIKTYCITCEKTCESDSNYRDKYTQIERIQKCMEARKVFRQMDLIETQNGTQAKELRLKG